MSDPKTNPTPYRAPEAKPQAEPEYGSHRTDTTAKAAPEPHPVAGSAHQPPDLRDAVVHPGRGAETGTARVAAANPSAPYQDPPGTLRRPGFEGDVITVDGQGYRAVGWDVGHQGSPFLYRKITP